MSDIIAAALPAPQPECRVTVVIPARDEATTIGTTLAALLKQTTTGGNALARGTFEIIVFANNCSDETANVTRRIAARTPQLRTYVIEDDLPAESAHVGAARKLLMDVAASRYLAAKRPHGMIASIDSDTIAGPNWIETMLAESRGCDAVAGRVTLSARDIARLRPAVRRLYECELTYRRILAEVEALIDPLPEDPLPRHGLFVGASFAVSAGCYVRAGGLPPLPKLEDVAFSRALRRVDAKIRYSLAMRATTSARMGARVDGGFGSFMAMLHAAARRGTSYTVEHPLRTLEDLESRAAIRRLWQGRPHADDIARITTLLHVPSQEWLASIDSAQPFGSIAEQVFARAERARRPVAPAPVEVAIEILRATRARIIGEVPAPERSLESLEAG